MATGVFVGNLHLSELAYGAAVRGGGQTVLWGDEKDSNNEPLSVLAVEGFLTVIKRSLSPA